MSMIDMIGIESRLTEDRLRDCVSTDEFDKRHSSGSSEKIQITLDESSVSTDGNQKRNSTGSSEEIQSNSPGSFADRVSRATDDELKDLFFGKRSGPVKKLHNITWVDGTQYRTHLTYEELAQYRKELDELMAHPPGWNDPNTYKEEGAELCHQCFPIIQKQFPEMAEFELVEPMAGRFFMAYSGFAHVNFKAKHKYAEDACGSVYFAEVDIVNKEVTRLSKLHIDPSFGTDCYEHCCYCHSDPRPCYADYIYHPNTNVTWSSVY